MAATEIPQETNRGYSIKALSFDPPLTSSITTNPETAIFSKLIKGGVMGTAKEMSFNIFCTLNTGIAAPTLTLKVKLGSGTMTIIGGLGLSLNLSGGAPFRIEGAITNYNSASSQYIWARLHTPTSTVPLILNTNSAYMDTTWTVNTAVDQTFSVTAQFGGLITGTTLATKYIKLDLS